MFLQICQLLCLGFRLRPAIISTGGGGGQYCVPVDPEGSDVDVDVSGHTWPELST